MKETVQIINFRQSNSFPSNYILYDNGIKDPCFNQIRINPSIKKSIIEAGAKNCIEYKNGHEWKHVTGLFPIAKNLFVGDVNSETAGIWLDTEKVLLTMVIIKGHKTRDMTARKKRVIQLINEQKNKG